MSQLFRVTEFFGGRLDVGQKVSKLAFLETLFAKWSEKGLEIFLGFLDGNRQERLHLINDFPARRSKQGVIDPGITNQKGADFVGQRRNTLFATELFGNRSRRCG